VQQELLVPLAQPESLDQPEQPDLPEQPVQLVPQVLLEQLALQVPRAQLV
jgi:hypothetical protein